jgi:alkylation response protein AidB-like acyl-CoA dehydrogenase
MQLHPTADQKLLQETTRRFLADTCPLDEVRSLGDGADGFDRSWWARAAELGWTSLLAPESLGGGGISDDAVCDLALVAYERGRMVAPGPFASTNVAIATLGAVADRSEHQSELIEQLMSGASVAAVALDEPGTAWGPDGHATTLRAVGESLELNGHKAPVEVGAQADVVLVAALHDDDPVLVLVPTDAEGVSVTPRRSVDLVRRFAEIDLDGVQVPASAVVARGAESIERCIDVGAVLQLAETVGAIDRVFEFTVEWAFDRHAFGRPLASYQELKHRFADMRLWLEASKATVLAAAVAVARDAPNAAELVSTASSYVDEHAVELVQDCVQMHGGIGVTWEHDIHLYLRRVTSNSVTYGTTRDHRERLASMILGGQ